MSFQSAIADYEIEELTRAQTLFDHSIQQLGACLTDLGLVLTRLETLSNMAAVSLYRVQRTQIHLLKESE